jgi:hypothetical protein
VSQVSDHEWTGERVTCADASGLVQNSPSGRKLRVVSADVALEQLCEANHVRPRGAHIFVQ